MFTNGGRKAEEIWIIKIKKKIRVHSCLFVAKILSLETFRHNPNNWRHDL